MKTLHLLIIFFLFVLSGCKNPLDETGLGKSTIDNAYNALLQLPASFSFSSYDMSSSQVTLYWGSSERADSYQVKYGTASGVYSTTASCTTSPCTITSLTNGTTYYFTVIASNPRGDTYVNNELVVTPLNAPTVPSGLAATSANGSVAITWSASTGNGTIKYKVLRSTTSGSGYSQIATDITTTNYTDTSVINDTIYYYVVRSFNEFGEGTNSSEVTGTPMNAPTSPTGLAATANTSQIALTWTASTGSGTKTYTVYRSTTSGSGYSQIATSLSSTSYTDSSVTNGTTYYYVVKAANLGGTSNYSSEISTTPLAAPSSVTASGTTSQVSLSWTSVTGATSYNVYRSTISGNYVAVTPFTTATNGYVDTTVTNGLTYYYVVTAVKGSSESSQSSEVTSMPLIAPTGLAATAGTTSIVLNWTSVAGATGYTIYRSTTSGSYGSSLATSATNSYTDSSVSIGVIYYYTIKTNGTNSQSIASSEVNAKAIPTVQFQVTSQSVNEGAGTLNIVVTLSNTSAQSVSVPITYSGTAAYTTRYTGPSTVTIAAGQISANLTLTLVDDSTEQLDQTIIATIGTPTNATLGTNTANTTTLQDNDYPTLSISDVTVTEGAPAYFTVSLNRTSIRNVTFDFYTQDNSALAGTNYLSYSGSDSITAGSTSKTYYVLTYPDYVTPTSSSSKYFYFKLQNTTNISGSSNATGTATLDKPSVYIPLTNSLLATRPTTGMSPSYSRTDSSDYVATVTDFEGIIRYVKSGEARFQGARRVENLVSYSENLTTNWLGNATAVSYSATGGPFNNGYTQLRFTGQQYFLLSSGYFTNKVLPNKTYQFSAYIRTSSSNTGGNVIRLSQEGTACNNGGSGCNYWNTTVDSTWKRYTVKFSTGSVAGTFQPLFYQFSGDYSGTTDLDISSVQVEDVSSQTNQAPGDYVSCGVQTSPYNGAGVDCVKYFSTYNGNSFNSTTHLVTEATGASIPVAQNLLMNSNIFSSWSNFNPSTFTANAGIAPDGTNTAWNANNTYTNSGGKAQTITLTNPVVGDVYVFSIWAKKASVNSSTCAYLQINLSGGSNGASSVSSCSAITDQWQRYQITKIIDYSDRTSLLVTMGNNTGTANTNMLYWGAQLEKASSPSRYIATTSTASTQYMQGYFAESSSANLASYNSDFSQGVYTKSNSTVSLMTAIAPDGASKVYKHIPNSGSNASNIYRSITTGVNAQPYTMSLYAKAAEYSKIFIGQDWASISVIDLSNGSVISGSVYRIINIGNGWYRIFKQGNGNGIGNYDMIFGALSNSYSLNGNNTPTQTADGASGVYLWGLQLEAHSTSPYVPSSLMATISSSSQSRGTDSLSYPSANFVNSAGTISANYSQLSSDTINRNYLFSITDSGNSRMALRTSDAGAAVPQFIAGNGTSNSTISFSSGSQSYYSQNLIFARFNTSASSLTYNGTSSNGTGGYIDPGSSSIYFGSGTSQNILIKNIKSSPRYFDSTEVFDFGF